MGERDQGGQLVERQAGDRERFLTREFAVLFEESAFGGNERVCGHAGIVMGAVLPARLRPGDGQARLAGPPLVSVRAQSRRATGHERAAGN